MSKALKKQLLFFSALCDIVQIFGNTELGTCELDLDAISQYLCSDKFWVDTFDFNTKEEIYQKLTDDILQGFRVWEFLKISDWTKNMIDKSFFCQQQDLLKQLKSKYKCYTCKYYQENYTKIGMIEKCTYKSNDNKFYKRNRVLNLPRTECVNFIRKRLKNQRRYTYVGRKNL